MDHNQMSFDWGQTSEYLGKVFEFELEKEELNQRMSDARKTAEALGVPTKAVQLAVTVARKTLKAHELLTQAEFDELVELAREKQEMTEAAQSLGEKGPSALTG